MTEPTLTQIDAATAFAKAWNRLEPSHFLKLMAPTARYASQWVFEELVGYEAIESYLKSKMRTVKAHAVNNPNSCVYAELGRTRGGQDCVFLAQGRKENVTAVVVFEISDGQISRYDLCIPEIVGVTRTGIYPI